MSKYILPTLIMSLILYSIVKKNNTYNSYSKVDYSEREYTSKPLIAQTKTNDIVWKVGDKLNHTGYGFGIVLSVKGELIEVAFKDSKVGVKTMLGKHASLTKI